ncbi:MAG: hypothetical protein OWT28_02435 [Firmicutes bacterium]|uniref:hypothetical protein n=1 Tax=Alicyclobacillus sp. SP_1 TaxID=2942475 RepID=UPI002157A8B4|nr:hypothetical protein [Alicyclobacillus sp. SP_1]MCY0875122.1 hypothetical protein [Bacillota bacterium]
MQWPEVRELYPNQWVLLEELKSHYNGSNVCVDEVALIRAILDAKEATEELFAAKDRRFVYHTSKEAIVIREIQKPMIRRRATGAN